MAARQGRVSQNGGYSRQAELHLLPALYPPPVSQAATGACAGRVRHTLADTPADQCASGQTTARCCWSDDDEDAGRAACGMPAAKPVLACPRRGLGEAALARGLAVLSICFFSYPLSCSRERMQSTAFSGGAGTVESSHVGTSCTTAVAQVSPSSSLWLLASRLDVSTSCVPSLEQRLAARRAAAVEAARAAAEAAACAQGQEAAAAVYGGVGNGRGAMHGREQSGASAAGKAPAEGMHAGVQAPAAGSACAVRSERQGLAAQRVAALEEELRAAEGMVAELQQWLAQAQMELDSAVLEGTA